MDHPSKLLQLWIGGFGQALVGATCPLVGGLLLLTVLYSLREWRRPANLLRRILILRRGRWIATLVGYSLLSIAYVWSLEVLNQTQSGATRQGIWRTEQVIPLLWFVLCGVMLTAANVVAVLSVPCDALHERGIWITVRKVWTDQPEEEVRKTFAHQSWVYSDGSISAKPLPHLECPSVTLKRRERGWRVVPHPFTSEQGESWSVIQKRPSVRDQKRIPTGEWRKVQEGDVLVFESSDGTEENWYLLVKSIRP